MPTIGGRRDRDRKKGRRGEYWIINGVRMQNREDEKFRVYMGQQHDGIVTTLP